MNRFRLPFLFCSVLLPHESLYRMFFYGELQPHLHSNLELGQFLAHCQKRTAISVVYWHFSQLDKTNPFLLTFEEPLTTEGVFRRRCASVRVRLFGRGRKSEGHKNKSLGCEKKNWQLRFERGGYWGVVISQNILWTMSFSPFFLRLAQEPHIERKTKPPFLFSTICAASKSLIVSRLFCNNIASRVSSQIFPFFNDRVEERFVLISFYLII